MNPSLQFPQQNFQQPLQNNIIVPSLQQQEIQQAKRNQDIIVFQTPQKLQKKVIKKKSTKNQRFIYQCDMCPQTFTQLFNMHNHIKNIHQLNPHVCPQCTPEGVQGIKGITAFSHVKDLKDHARKAHQGKLIRLQRDQKIYLSEEEFQIRMKCNEELKQNNGIASASSSTSLSQKTTNPSYQQTPTINNNQVKQLRPFNNNKSSIEWNREQTESLMVKEEDDDESSPLFSDFRKSSSESSTLQDDAKNTHKSEILLNQGWINYQQAQQQFQFRNMVPPNAHQFDRQCGYRNIYQLPFAYMPMIPVLVKEEN